MDEFFDQFFPTEFLIEYLENGPEENMDRSHFCGKGKSGCYNRIKGYVRVSALYGQSL